MVKKHQRAFEIWEAGDYGLSLKASGLSRLVGALKLVPESYFFDTIIKLFIYLFSLPSHARTILDVRLIIAHRIEYIVNQKKIYTYKKLNTGYLAKLIDSHKQATELTL